MHTTEIYARQGDLNINPVGDAAAPSMVQRNQPLTIAGSHEGAHVVPAGCWHCTKGNRHFVMLPEGGELSHASRHKPVKLEPGVTYEIWPAIERHGDTDRDVED